MRASVISVATLLLVLVTLTACQSSVPLDQYDQDIAEADKRVQSLEDEISELRQEIDRLRDSVPDLAAKEILGQWNSVIPSSARLRNGAESVTDIFITDPDPGPSEQLNRALMRMAFIAARDMVGSDVRYAEPDEQYRILNQCLEYIMGINSVTRACGLE